MIRFASDERAPTTPEATRRETPGMRLVADRVRASFVRGGVERVAVDEVSLGFPERAITAIIGPSGCGKSTFLRCLNRLHETAPGARVAGHVWLDGRDV